MPDRISCSARTTAEVIDVLNFTPRRSNALKKFETTPRWRKWAPSEQQSELEGGEVHISQTAAARAMQQRCLWQTRSDGGTEGGRAQLTQGNGDLVLLPARAVDAGGMNKGRLFLSSLFIHPRIMNHEVEFRAGKEERA